MSIDFKKHLLTQLQNDTVYNLPDVEVINSDIEFALACWKNFSVHLFPHASLTIEAWYSAGKWKTNLNNYKEDINFWEKALEEGHFHYEVLLYENFQQDFPIITNHYLKNNEKLESLYLKTGKEEFFNLIDSSEEEKYKIKNYYYAEKGNRVPQEFITQYEHDPSFTIKLLTRNAGYFQSLNKDNRSKPEYIKLALSNNPLNFEYLSESDRDNGEYIKLAFSRKANVHLHKIAANFHLLSEQRKESLFSSWLKHFGLYLSGSDIPKLNEMQREEVFKFRPELLEGVLQNQSKKYGDLTKKLLNEDFNKYISYISMNLLLDEYKTLEDILPIKIDLENYINTYIPKTKLSRKDKNILYLIKLDDDLRVKLNENIGYKINTIIEKPEKISSETFFEFTNEIIVLCNAKDINEEQSELYVKTLRGKLDSSAHKELKLPKEGIFNYLCMLKLNEKLHATLPSKEIKSKNKI